MQTISAGAWGCVFDTTRIVTAQDGTSRIDHLDEHLSRFARSIAGVNGPTPDLDSWNHLIEEAARTWRIPGEAALKLVYTNGRQVVPGPPRGFLIISPFPKLQSKNGRESTCCVYPVGSLATPSPMLPGSSVGSRPCPMPSTSQLCAMPDPRRRRRHLHLYRRLPARRTNLWVSHRG
ncbi:aminodeoxychorismate lyase [Cutibacterium acnes JCM 18918]|nr:aminodeoxychorismate lyase [Cutibacterium acnes JCM 18918]